MKISAAVAAALTSMVVVAGCGIADPPPFDPRSLGQPERDRSREVQSQPKRPLPTTLESPFLVNTRGGSGPSSRPKQPPPTGPTLDTDVTVRMPLQEIIQRAVANNLDVRVAGYTPAIDETRVTEAEARFDPVFFSDLTFGTEDRGGGLFNNTFGNANTVTSRTGVRQNFSSGGQASVSYQAQWIDPAHRTDTLGQTTRAPQIWVNDVVFELQQPLLRNFGNEINRARITINRNNQRISLLEFRKQLEESASDIERTYWQIVSAEREVRINEQLLNETVRTADVLFKRIGQDVTRVQISQANASVESRRATLIRSRARVKDLSDQLKRLMNDPEWPVASGAQILPANPPVEEPIRFDLKDQIDTALENRFELGEQQFRVDSASTAALVGKNNILPQLNAVGSFSISGNDTNFGDTTEQQGDFRDLSYSIGVQFEVPIGNREARAVYQRALLQRQQAVDQYRNLVEQISLEVKTALREVDTTWDEMVATRQARFAAADALLAIQQREEGGEALTPTFVQLKLDTQERLAQAQLAEVQAVSNYNTALANLERTKGTLLRYNNIVMEEDSNPIGWKPRG